MPFLPALSVVFVGVTGGSAGKVDKQLQAVVEAVHVERGHVSAADVRTLARHGEGAREVVEKLHSDGVISGELVVDHHQVSLHVVIYGGDGAMKSYNEMSLAGLRLSKDELEVLRANIADEVSSLAPMKRAPHPARKETIADPFATAEIEMSASHAPPPLHQAAPVETADASADAVSIAELEALTSGNEVVATDLGGGGNATASTLSPESLHLGVELGFGVASRSFTPGMATIAAYASSPVGALRAAAHVQPTARTRLDASFERALAMSTPLPGGAAATSMSRWEIAGAYTLVHSAIDIRARVGLGHRAFSIDSIDPSRSPDSDYGYLIAGTAATLAIGDKITLEGNVAYEPVMSGTDAMKMSFGPASRSAIDAGFAAELRPVHQIFIRAAFDYQRFGVSWAAAGSRGAGGAVDAYPSGVLSLGAHY